MGVGQKAQVVLVLGRDLDRERLFFQESFNGHDVHLESGL